MRKPKIIERKYGLTNIDFLELISYRELIYFIVWKDIKVRYKQTALGVIWIIIQPIITILVFSYIFGGLLKVSSGGVPYPVFAFAGLLPWTYFSASLSRSSTSLVGNSNLITKVYFPRLILPLAGAITGLIDLAISFVVFFILMALYSINLTNWIFGLPLFLFLGFINVFGFSLWFSALNVRYRDIVFIVPFILQIWMYITPIIYQNTLIPEQFRFLLLLNPITGVVDGFRGSLLGVNMDQINSLLVECGVSLGLSLVVLISGLIYFQKTERTFADII